MRSRDLVMIVVSFLAMLAGSFLPGLAEPLTPFPRLCLIVLLYLGFLSVGTEAVQLGLIRREIDGVAVNDRLAHPGAAADASDGHGTCSLSLVLRFGQRAGCAAAMVRHCHNHGRFRNPESRVRGQCQPRLRGCAYTSHK